MIRAIFSCDSFGGIGNRGSLPWTRHPLDAQWFDDNTRDGIVVMGKTTWDERGAVRPLPGRTNVIITHKIIAQPGVICYSTDWQQRVKSLGQRENQDVWIVGGGEILEQSRDILDEIYITRMKGKYYTDVSVDLTKYLAGWRVGRVRPGDSSCTFEVWRRWWTV